MCEERLRPESGIRVPDETREAVQFAIEALGDIPDIRARLVTDEVIAIVENALNGQASARSL